MKQGSIRIIDHDNRQASSGRNIESETNEFNLRTICNCNVQYCSKWKASIDIIYKQLFHRKCTMDGFPW